jgi:predicted DNA binding CopG/RHH family protein
VIHVFPGLIDPFAAGRDIRTPPPAREPQYGPLTKVSIVPVTVGVLAPTNNLSGPQGDQETQERRGRMRRRGFQDDEERDLINAYQSGEFRPVEDQKAAKQTAVQAARRYLRKDARVNIRLSTADLEMLKRRAAEEGLPYQSLIASVLHKYVSGSAFSGNKGG